MKPTNDFTFLSFHSQLQITTEQQLNNDKLPRTKQRLTKKRRNYETGANRSNPETIQQPRWNSSHGERNIRNSPYWGDDYWQSDLSARVEIVWTCWASSWPKTMSPWTRWVSDSQGRPRLPSRVQPYRNWSLVHCFTSPRRPMIAGSLVMGRTSLSTSWAPTSMLSN